MNQAFFQICVVHKLGSNLHWRTDATTEADNELRLFSDIIMSMENSFVQRHGAPCFRQASKRFHEGTVTVAGRCRAGAGRAFQLTLDVFHR